MDCPVYMEVSLFQRIQPYICQCEGPQMGQRNGVLLKEVAAFWRCPFIEVSLYAHTYKCMFVCCYKQINIIQGS